MKLTQIGLLTLGAITLIQAEIYVHTTEALKKNGLTKIKEASFTPKIEIIGNLTTIIPKENSIVTESLNGNNTAQNVSNYILPKIKNKKLKIGDTAISLCGEKTYLVAVGINQYKNMGIKLREAVNDAKKMAKKIKQNCANTQTHLLLDAKATKKKIIDTIKEVNKKATKRDAIIFFYSGNGFNYQNKNYIVSYDSKLKKEKPIINTFIGVKEVSSLFNSYKIKKGLMIFDSCTSRIDNRTR